MIAVIGLLVVTGCTKPPVATVIDAATHTSAVEFLSRPFVIDQLYPSMAGPAAEDPIKIGTSHERIWLTGYDVTVTDDAGTPLPSQHNLCHAQVTYADREALRHRTGAMPPKWFIVVPGQASIQFPEGFGIPMFADEPLSAMTMVLNQDPNATPFTVRMRTRLFYRPETELTSPLTPLGRFAVAVNAPLQGHQHSGSDLGCTITSDDGAVTFAKAVTGTDLLSMQGDQMVTQHFLVPPGTQTYIQKFSGKDQLPFDTTLHHISAHLHVYGQSIELWDTTAQKKLFTSIATDDADHRYVTNMTSYSSTEGIPVYRDHDYELRATYDNTTDHEVDGMAVMYMYFADR